MRKLALNDEILLKIEKPARYIGNEVNSVMKDPEKVSIRFAMCFPDVYEIGMSHLGIQILYDMFNKREDVWCERVYSPWTDLDQIMRERRFRCLHWNPRIRLRNSIFLESRCSMRCVIPISCRFGSAAFRWHARKERTWISDRDRRRSVYVQSGAVSGVL